MTTVTWSSWSYAAGRRQVSLSANHEKSEAQIIPVCAAGLEKLAIIPMCGLYHAAIIFWQRKSWKRVE
jgi:hypothetical protein